MFCKITTDLYTVAAGSGPVKEKYLACFTLLPRLSDRNNSGIFCNAFKQTKHTLSKCKWHKRNNDTPVNWVLFSCLNKSYFSGYIAWTQSSIADFNVLKNGLHWWFLHIILIRSLIRHYWLLHSLFRSILRWRWVLSSAQSSKSSHQVKNAWHFCSAQ